MDNNQPIIVKRVKKVVGGHHGGAWKIAFADFATAMMAFFLVMWLMTTATPEQRAAIAGYFQDPLGYSEAGTQSPIDLGGTPVLAPDNTPNPEMKETLSQDRPDALDQGVGDGMAEEIERERLELLMQQLQEKIQENAELHQYKDQILLEVTQDGLRIQILDDESRPMFALGSAQLQPYFEDILLAMAGTINQVPNKVSISGHTDAKPFSSEKGGFGNWELSAGRANAARRTLVAGGYAEEQVARVVGYASSILLDREDPFNPVNRRIDIVVLTKRAQRAIESEADAEEPVKAAEPKPGSSEAINGDQLRDRLNIFDEGALRFEE